MFAIAVSMANIGFYFCSSTVGLLWNKIFTVTAEDLTCLYKLIILQVILSAITILYVPLIPTWADIAKSQEYLNKVAINEREKSTDKHLLVSNGDFDQEQISNRGGVNNNDDNYFR